MHPLDKMDNSSIAYVHIFLLANKIQTTVDAGLGDITAKQWLMLVVLGVFEKPPNLKQLSEACGITHQSARQLLEKLVSKGYISVEKDGVDKRAIRIIPTAKYEAWHEKYETRNRRFIQKLFTPLTEEEIEIFLKVQMTLQENIAVIAKEHFDDFIV